MIIKNQLDADATIYPDSDGKPMADNTLQFNWITTLKTGFENLYNHRDDVFVAGDLLWYPTQGSPAICVAPDTLIAFGRPKGYRGSYRQWDEGGIAPQVVFEVLSPNNTKDEMAKKLRFYEQHGVEEYYVYDPEGIQLAIYCRNNQGQLQRVRQIDTYVSPRTGVRFQLTADEMVVYGPDGRRFLKVQEVHDENERLRRENATVQGEAERERRARAAAMEEAERERRARAAAMEEAERERQEKAAAMEEAERERQEKAAAVKAANEAIAAAEREKAAAVAEAERLAALLRSLGH